MKKWLLFTIINSVLLASCADKAADPSLNIIEKRKAEADFDLFAKIIKKSHPSLNLYVSKQRLSFLLDSLRSTIKEEETISDLYNKINTVANEIGCSHTIVDLPDYVLDTLENRQFFFPYPVKWIDNKLLVNVVGYDLPEGTEIKSINNEPVNNIVKKLMPYNSVEGLHRNTQQNLAGDNFSVEYFFKYGQCTKFTLQIKDTLGVERTVDQNSINLSDWSNRNANDKYYYDRIDVDYDLSVYSEKDYAYMRIATFEFPEGQKLNAFENFCTNSFDLLNRKNIKSVIIDLRENTGGLLYSTFLLYSFLADKPFAEYEKVISTVNKIPYDQYLDSDFANENVERINNRLNAEFLERLNNQDYSIPDSLIQKWEPDNIHFKGDVYVITNSNVVSAASYFAVMIKNSGRGKIIGEETTGGAYSANGFTTLKYVLPNSGIRFCFPFAHMLYTFKDNKNKGNGLIPDYYVPDSYTSFKENKDSQITFVIDSLILNKKKN